MASTVPLVRQYAGLATNGLPEVSLPCVQSELHHCPTVTLAVRSTLTTVVAQGSAGTCVQLPVFAAFMLGSGLPSSPIGGS